MPVAGREHLRHNELDADELAPQAVEWAEGILASTGMTNEYARASGHSIIGLAVCDRTALRAEASGRCWSQGRLLAWLADS